jgi:hypothetical protein
VSFKPRFAFPYKIPFSEKTSLKYELRQLMAQVGSGLNLGIAPEAKKNFEKWYCNLERSIHTKRLDGYAIRFMGLLAVNEFLTEITPEIVQQAIDLMDWQLKIRKRHDPINADNIMAKMEERIRRVLGEGPLSDRELKQKTHANRTGLNIFKNAVLNLTKDGEISHDAKLKQYKKL